MKALVTREKYAGEERVCFFDFQYQPEQAEGADLLSPVVTAAPSGLTIGSPSIFEVGVKVMVGGGEEGVVYVLQCDAETSLGATMTIYGKLKILVTPTP